MLTSQRHARSWTSASPSRCTTRRRKRDDGARAAVGGDQRGLRIGLRTTFAGTPSHGCISRNCGWERACSFWARQKRRSRSCAASRRSNLRVDTYTRQTFGCDTCRAIRTSLRKRASAASLVCAAWEMNFSATGERGPRRESTLLDREDGGHGAAKGRPSDGRAGWDSGMGCHFFVARATAHAIGSAAERDAAPVRDVRIAYSDQAATAAMRSGVVKE
jgi:hypothetical protein